MYDDSYFYSLEENTTIFLPNVKGEYISFLRCKSKKKKKKNHKSLIIVSA